MKMKHSHNTATLCDVCLCKKRHFFFLYPNEVSMFFTAAHKDLIYKTVNEKTNKQT